MMSGLIRTVLTFLAVVAIAAPLVVLTPVNSVHAQGV